MKRITIVVYLMAIVALSATGQVSPKTAELGWLELPSFSEDPEHFFVSHHTDEYWGKQRNYSLFWDQVRQIPLWVAYPLNQRLIGKGHRSGAWQYDKFMATKKQPNLRRTYQAGSVEGYIRGHLCPSNDRMRPGMNEQTFYFTNMAPQDPYLNGGLWAWLEEYVQQLALSARNAPGSAQPRFFVFSQKVAYLCIGPNGGQSPTRLGNHPPVAILCGIELQYRGWFDFLYEPL